MRITVLLGGTNIPSNSAVLTDAFLGGIRTSFPQAEITILHLKDLPLPHFTLECYHPDYAHQPEVQQLRDAVLNCDGLVIASPVWNFSVPSHLKNALDHLGTFCLDAATHSRGQLNDRPCYFLFTGGAPLIAWKALLNITTLHVSEALKYYGGSIVGRHFEPKCLPGRGKFGLVLDQRTGLTERLSRKGAYFAQTVEAFKSTGDLPPLLRLRRSVATWAYRIGNRIMYPVSSAQ